MKTQKEAKKKMDLDTAVTLIMGEMQKLATKNELIELEKKMDDGFTAVRQEMKDGFAGSVSRMGGVDNRIDNEVAARKDLEKRVRTVVPNLPLAPERV